MKRLIAALPPLAFLAGAALAQTPVPEGARL